MKRFIVSFIINIVDEDGIEVGEENIDVDIFGTDINDAIANADKNIREHNTEWEDFSFDVLDVEEIID